jgi:MoxR-like ATPase
MSQRETMVAPPVAFSPDLLRKLAELETAVGAAIRGKAEVVRLSLVCLLARGHLLIEDVPGVGKTTLAQALSRAVSCRFHRLQFTSDMLPSDVLGVTIYNAHSGTFEFKPGPIFSNFLLADEINRTTPKTQSALLEAMNESQVTIDGKSHSLPRPFMVIATQNPVEHHGTYPLPESQLDRFLMRLRIGYPDTASEREILRNTERELTSPVSTGLVAEDVLQLQDAVHRVTVDESIVDYMLAIVEQTRTHESLALGVSPRGSQALYRAAQALAVAEGRDYCIPDDAKRLAVPLFAHRVVINTRTTLIQRKADAAERIIEEILSQVEVPL